MMLVKAFAAFKQPTLEPVNKSAEERYEKLMTTDRKFFTMRSFNIVRRTSELPCCSLSGCLPGPRNTIERCCSSSQAGLRFSQC